MKGRTCLITGGTAGIGLETAKALAARGADVVIVGRDAGRGEAAVAAVRGAAPDARVDFLAADLGDQKAVRAVAGRVTDRWPALDVLVNNAGGMFGRRTLGADGIEMTFALNHLSYFLLTALLMESLRAAGTARIVNVASRAHEGVTLDFDDLEGARRYSGWFAYKRSKLANLLFTYELARRLDGSGVVVNALHPGFVATTIGTRNRWTPGVLWRLMCLAAIPVEKGAETPVYLASAPEAATSNGQYFHECRPVRSSPASYDRDAAARLWAVSEAMTGA